jgi:uncharacterized protein (TIGR02302 family)
LSETTQPVNQKKLFGLPRRIRWRVQFVYLVMLFEILWSSLWPAMGFVGLYLALSFFDLWLALPGILQFCALVITFGLSGWSFWREIKRHRWPQERDALRRLETASALSHRPLSSLFDDLLGDGSDQATTALWREHRRTQLISLRGIQADGPKSDLPERDPMALRVLVSLILVVSFFFAGNDWPNRFGLAFQPTLSFSKSGASEVTAWVNPPDFTGLAPIFLDPERTDLNRTHAVPQNSTLVLRISKARGVPALTLPVKSAKVLATLSESEVHEINHTLVHTGIYALKDRGRKLGAWRFSVTPDAVPFAAFEKPPLETVDNALSIAFTLHDDYGIDKAQVHFEIKSDIAQSEAGDPVQDAEKADVKFFDIDLPLPSSAPKTVSERADFNLTAHPFAGLAVTGQIHVVDLGGQEGVSEVVQLTLPERQFFEPLALALVEQRRNLVRDPSDWAHVMRAMEALTLAPERFFDDLTVYIGLRTAYWQLDRIMPERRSQIMPTVDLLWDLALHIEDGNLSLAERELRAIAEALMEALARGASMDEIQRLLQRYQQALERYLAALAEDALAEQQEGIEPPPGDGQSVEQQDLLDLLKAIEELARTGDRSAAREMVAQLQRMLENMTMSAAAGMNGPESDLAEQIEGLSDLIGKERALMDETLRRSQEKGGGSDTLFPGLAGEQSGLKDELAGVKPSLSEDKDKTKAGQALDEAAEAMEEAEGALKSGDTRYALHAQKRSIDAMREAAQAMAEELMQSMQARGAQGQDGPDLDPLGREEGKGGAGFGDHIKVPDERDLQRAREILEELQNRASDPTRPELELEYLERLLKRF